MFVDHRSIPLLTSNSNNQAVQEKLFFPQRDYISAKKAYSEKDKEASRQAHLVRPLPLHCHAERHVTTSSDYLKCLVFGGLDGIVTIFAIVAGCVGAHLSPIQTMIVGVGNLLADAVSMGFGEYVSAKTESDYISNEKARELWEVENFPDGEKQEMIEIYEHKYGFTPEDARTMVEISFKYKDFCIAHMMAEELGLLVDDEVPSPIRRGGVMFCAFCLFGLVPLAGFGLSSWIILGGLAVKTETIERQIYVFLAASIVSLITLYVLGAVKATFINQSSVKSGLQMVANGLFAGIVAFGVGAFLQDVVGESIMS